MHEKYLMIFEQKCKKYKPDELKPWLLEQLAREAAIECAASEKYHGKI